MTQKFQIFKCEICGNIIEILHSGKGELVCCNQSMKLIEEKFKGEYALKHSPVIEGNKIKVGSVEHPMENSHYIEWIEAISENAQREKIFLNPGQKPEAVFCFKPIKARVYCNIHGLWKT